MQTESLPPGDRARNPSPSARGVLMVAYHFPPLAGSSGIQRTMRFVQHLPALGWAPMVLSTHQRAYERTSPDLLEDIPPGTPVERAFALDAARHLSIGGRYLAATALPDRWASWRFDGVRRGLAMVRRHRPSLLWSTYPIATAHLIGAELHRRTGLPWVADFRDPMAQPDYPADRRTWKAFDALERRTITEASASVFTTASAADEYRRRYPEAAERIHLIENGYDEETFAGAEATHERRPLTQGALTLLHSGIVYASERDPTQLIMALRRLRDAGVASAQTFRMRFRAAVSEALIRGLAEQHGVSDLVEVLPAVPYKQALAEMLSADALVVMQASNCNAQIPAKLYEYLRAGRPVLGLADPAGDTARALAAAGVEAVAPLHDVEAIVGLLGHFITDRASCPSLLARPDAVRDASRRARTQALVRLFDSLPTHGAAGRAAPAS